MSQPRYKRILLKMSGESLAGEGRFGIDWQVVDGVCEMIAEIVRMNVQVGVVVGAGNIFRGAADSRGGLDRPTGDYLGMLATIINSMALRGHLVEKGVKARVLSAINIYQIVEPFVRLRAIECLDNGEVVIFAGGTGNPFFTTDTAAALRAAEIGAEVLFKATRVEGVYDADPEKNPKAVKYDRLSCSEVLNGKLRAMDLTAVSLCMENKIPIIVFNISNPANLRDAVMGAQVGTLIQGG